MYVNEVLNGQCDGKAKPTIIKETPGTAYVDGHNGIGSVSTADNATVQIILQLYSYRTYCNLGARIN